MTCPCGEAWNGSEAPDSLPAAAEAIKAVRDACPALSHILLPNEDDTWPSFLKAAAEEADPAHHRPIVLLAFVRGHLKRMTSPIHRYLLATDGLPKDGVRKQYTNDLRERWFLKTNDLERHQKSRSFLGRLVELRCAEWLEADSWRITGLEAFREGPDIVAERAGDGPTAFEVKYLGQEDTDYEAIVESLAGSTVVRTKDLYGAVNYVLFRIYEAAKQLERVDRRRAVLFVVEDRTWHTVELQLKNNWIKWSEPRLYEAGKQWRNFLETQRAKYADIEGDLGPAIRGVKEIRILKLLGGFELSAELTFRPGA